MDNGSPVSNRRLRSERAGWFSPVNRARAFRGGRRWCAIALSCLLTGAGAAIGPLCLGCSGYPYIGDRLRDTADVLTFSAGIGGGAKTRVGPVQVGALVNVEFFLIRGGEWQDGLGADGAERSFMVIPWKQFLADGGPETVFGEEWFSGDGLAEKRGKQFCAFNEIPFVTTRVIPPPNYEGGYPYYYFGQVEIVVGLGISLRCGVNVLEFVDFLVGWTTLDILADDVSQ